MLFGRSGQQQAQTPQGAGFAQGAGPQQGSTGLNGAQQPVSAWTGAGYPTQPSGTGYAGYTPGAGQQMGAQGSVPGSYASAQGYQAGYPQSGYSQNGYNAAGYPVYPQAGQGYAAQGNTAGQQGYAAPQMGQGYAQGGYAPQGYAQGQGYAYPQAGMPQGGGGQAGYPQGTGAQGGYQAQGYSAQGYNAFAQMGRNQAQPAPQNYSSQIPLNGGGYVPPAVPVKKQPFQFKSWMLIALGAALAVMFAVGLFVPGWTALLWVFIILAAASIAFFWIRPLISGNQRLCYTIVFGVLALVAVLSALGLLSPRTDRTNSPPDAPATAAPAGNSGSVIDPETGSVYASVEETEVPPTATPAVEDTSTADRLDSFFRYWAANKLDDMLTLCAPSWQSGEDNPRSALFRLLANRTPLDYEIEKISGTSEDTSRTVTVTSTMDRNNGKDPVKYRLSVLMVRDGTVWYVDPQSLKTYEEAETEDPASAATATPTAEPLVSGSTILYYNPDGGTKYHLDQNCKSTHAKFLPFKGHFTYAEVNDDKYKGLSPCNVCAAPLRP